MQTCVHVLGQLCGRSGHSSERHPGRAGMRNRRLRGPRRGAEGVAPVRDPLPRRLVWGKCLLAAGSKKRYLVFKGEKKKKGNLRRFLIISVTVSSHWKFITSEKLDLESKLYMVGMAGHGKSGSVPVVTGLLWGFVCLTYPLSPHSARPLFSFPIMQCIIQGLISKQNHPLHCGSEKDL